MTSFSILEQNCAIDSRMVLEASAGTGKTFSIENLVTRMLLENKELSLDQVLLVTFTKAATAELKERVRRRLQLTAQQLRVGDSDGVPDYLLPLMEGEASERLSAMHRLEDALYTFEDAPVYTIHGFCAQLLHRFLHEAGCGMEENMESAEDPSFERQLALLRDFLRTEVTRDLVSPAQLSRLLRGYKYDMDRLGFHLLRLALQPLPLEKQASFEELYQELLTALQALSFNQEELLHDFARLAPMYKKTCDRQGALFPKLQVRAEEEARILASGSPSRQDFDRWIGRGFALVESLDEAQRKARTKEPQDLRNPQALLALRDATLDIICRAKSPGCLLASLAGRLQETLNEISDTAGLLSPDQLLQRTQKAVEKPAFVEAVRQQYRIVIVDEFQDTDPVQWQIFRQLFAEDWEGRLCLVGDPKQSIYAFRNADIYTYLDAKTALGEDSERVLDTNYRSSPELVQALNQLFSAAKEDLFQLPHGGTSIPYRRVQAGISASDSRFSDDKGALHFFVAEGKIGRGTRWPSQKLEADTLFSYIANELVQLKRQGWRYGDAALLVRDRYQAESIQKLLKQCGIPAVVRRTQKLTETGAYGIMQDIVAAALRPFHIGRVKTALASPLIGWTHEELREAEGDPRFEAALQRWHELSLTLHNEGFCLFHERLLASVWKEDQISVAERLLATGSTLKYQEWHQIAELLVEEQYVTHCSAERLLSFLEELKDWDYEEEERLQVRQDQTVDAVSILTMHVSKGLEFPIVFAIGAIHRTNQKEELVRYRDQAGDTLVPAERNEEALEAHAAELDAEKLRQLYVALTRAKWRLYVPVANQLDRKKDPDPGTAAPMELLLQKLQLFPSCTLEDLTNLDPKGTISAEMIAEQALPHEHLEEEERVLCPPPSVAVPGESILISSFTAMASQHHAPTLENPPLDYEVEAPNLLNLPAGPATGTLLHTILELVDFNDPSRFAPVVDAQLSNTRLLPWRDCLIKLVERLSHTPLPWRGGAFALRDISRLKILREMEFLYRRDEQILVKGFIDLVVEYDGCLHIFDWKTNWLGDSYEQSQLEQGMKAHDYHLQAKLYRESLQKYLSAVGSDLAIGNTYYIFLRGIDGESSSGVYCIEGGHAC